MLEVRRTSSNSFSNPNGGNGNSNTASNMDMDTSTTAQAGAPGPSVPSGSLGASTPQHQQGHPQPTFAPYDPTASITAANPSNSNSNQPNAGSIISSTNGNANTTNTNGTPISTINFHPPTFRPTSTVNGSNPTHTANSNPNPNQASLMNNPPRNNSHNRLPPPTRESVLQRLSEALLKRSLAKIDLSQKGLTADDARLVRMALLQNQQLRVLKLGYNQLGDAGLTTLVAGISTHAQLQSLDLGFNNIGDAGCQALASAMANNSNVCQLSTLYLAGNCIGPDGAMALADVIRSRPSSSGGGVGSTAAPASSTLQRLYMTGNRLGPDGVKALTEAILEEVAARKMESNDVNNNDNNTNSNGSSAMDTSNALTTMTGASSPMGVPPTNTHASSSSSVPHSVTEAVSITSTRGMQELFLGGTGLEAAGCQAVARLLASPDCCLKVLSLANCDISDDEITRQDFGLASCIKGNRDCLQLTSLQLSFNNITHKGLEALMNALWGSRTLKELRLDNNDIGDRGAQQLAAILPYLKTLETLDVGFNSINNKNQGMKILMKAVAETGNLTTLSLSGNPMQDVSSAKAVAYALAYNTSLQSLLLVHCHLTTEGQRHVAAGAVSNSRTSLRALAGFPVGPVIVTLGFPDALEHWTNEQVLNFIHLMWNKTKSENDNGKEGGEDQGLDPLNFLPGSSSSDANKNGRRISGPLEATIVVDVARKAFASLVANGVDVFSRRPGHPNGKELPAVLAPRDAIMLESVDGDSIVESMGEVAVSSRSPSSINMLELGALNGGGDVGASLSRPMTSASKAKGRSFVAPPQERDTNKQSQLPDPSRKKRIVEWLCSNIKHLNKLSQMPFDSGELLKLHQHYFTPVVNESGGSSAFPHATTNPGSSSVPNVSRDSANVHRLEDSGMPSMLSSSTGYLSAGVMDPSSDPMFADEQQQHPSHPQQPGGHQPAVASSLPMLKRKVSYRFLGDASMHHHHPTLPPPTNGSSLWGGDGVITNLSPSNPVSVANMIQNGPASGHHSLPPKNKRARRNRTRISFLPRIKAKLDSYLDVCHEKALATMRQLYYVEQAILNGRVNPLEGNVKSLQHLSGALATDAETIVVDMI